MRALGTARYFLDSSLVPSSKNRAPSVDAQSRSPRLRLFPTGPAPFQNVLFPFLPVAFGGSHRAIAREGEIHSTINGATVRHREKIPMKINRRRQRIDVPRLLERKQHLEGEVRELPPAPSLKIPHLENGPASSMTSSLASLLDPHSLIRADEHGKT